MEHGEIRVSRINLDDYADLSDYWILSMHDNFNGCIPKMALSYDHKKLLSCGHDGNLFSFYINDDTPDFEHEIPVPEHPLPLVSFTRTYIKSNIRGSLDKQGKKPSDFFFKSPTFFNVVFSTLRTLISPTSQLFHHVRKVGSFETLQILIHSGDDLIRLNFFPLMQILRFENRKKAQGPNQEDGVKSLFSLFLRQLQSSKVCQT